MLARLATFKLTVLTRLGSLRFGGVGEAVRAGGEVDGPRSEMIDLVSGVPGGNESPLESRCGAR